MLPSLDPILRPRSVAVVGASRQPNTIGWQIVDNLLRYGFQGAVYPVNPKAEFIHSIPAYPTVSAVGRPVDLAVITVPKEHVLAVVQDCVAAGVRGLVVISAGFKEVGSAGATRERELVEALAGTGIRLVGPNCMGVLNTAPDVHMNATFASRMPPPGPVAFMSQSGAMGLSVLDYAASYGIGFSSFVSAGNKADVSGNDLLEYWEHDPSTTTVLMYLENFGNPARFVELARRISRRKPICVVKSGRTGAGQRAAASHTGALAGTELATEAVIAQSGVIRAQTVEELFDLAMAFSNQPLPQGDRVAIVTNAGGPGIIIADACEANGLTVTGLAPATEQTLRSRLPEEASVRNPVDMIATATPDSYEFALDCVLKDPNVDAAFAAFVPPLNVQTRDVADAIVRVNARHPGKPLLAVLMGREGLPAGLEQLHDASVPGYIFPESAARALGAMWRYRQRQRDPEGVTKTFTVDDRAVTAILDRVAAPGGGKVPEPDALRILEAYGIPVTPWRFVPDENDVERLAAGAANAGAALGFPVALKIVDPAVTHKTDVGGVALGLTDRTAVKEAAQAMIARVPRSGAAGEPRVSLPVTPPPDPWNPRPPAATPAHSATPGAGLLVQSMAPEGREIIIGLTRVPRVGAMVMFGLGGVYVEVLRDVQFRLAPLQDVDARRMIDDVRMSGLLGAVRGQLARDRKALEETLLRVSQLAMRHPRIVEMDINPLIALAQGVVAVDARFQVETTG
jgi:acetyl coenzyme A synthetase (ADP forming)-like protein